MEEGGTDDTPVSRQTVYRWVQKFSKAAHSEVAKHKADSGAVWEAFAFPLGGSEGGCFAWFVVDRDSDYILAIHISASQDVNGASTVLSMARGHAERPPIAVAAAGSAHDEAVSQVFPDAVFRSQHGNVLQDLPPEFGDDLEAQCGRLRRMRDRYKALRHLSGWVVHHNLLGGYTRSDGRTPGEVAYVRTPFSDWAGVVSLRHPENGDAGSIFV